MTIKPGESWGTSVPRPQDLVIATNDAEAAALAIAGHTVGLGGGDLHRTVGGRPIEDAPELLRLPIDIFEALLDDGSSHQGIAHVVARRPGKLGWWRGEILAAMNAEFVGEWDVATRSHPNDGRLDVTRCPASFSLRNRIEARRRLPVGGHVPHPEIETTVVTHRRPKSFDFSEKLAVFVDGVRVGRSRTLELRVCADARFVHA